MSNPTPAPDVVELRYWLANEDWYPSRYTREWLARTPPREAADTLAGIATDADLDARSPGALLVTAFAASGFSPSNAIAGRNVDARKAGIRAALLLAEAGDPRALEPLERVFETGALRHKYQELIEQAVARLLTAPGSAETIAAEHAPLLERLARRIWATGGPRRDLTQTHAELVVAAMRHLGRLGASPGDLSEQIATSDGRRTPNRSAVRTALEA